MWTGVCRGGRGCGLKTPSCVKHILAVSTGHSCVVKSEKRGASVLGSVGGECARATRETAVGDPKGSEIPWVRGYATDLFIAPSCLYVLFIVLAYVSFLNPTRLQLPPSFLHILSFFLFSFLSFPLPYLILLFFLYTNDRRVFAEPAPQRCPHSPKRQGMSSLQVCLPRSSPPSTHLITPLPFAGREKW
jgi:hypothetical protein